MEATVVGTGVGTDTLRAFLAADGVSAGCGHAVVPCGGSVETVLESLAVIFVERGVGVVAHACRGTESGNEHAQILAQREVGVERALMKFVVSSGRCVGYRVVGACPGSTAAPQPVFLKLHGEGGRRQVVDQSPEVGGVAGLRHLAEHAQHVDLHQRGGTQVYVEVDAHVGPDILVLCVVAVVVDIVFDESLVRQQVEHGVVFKILATAVELRRDLVGHAVMTEGGVNPVDVGVEVGISTTLESTDLVGRVFWSLALVGQRLVHGSGIGGCADELRAVDLIVEQMVVGDSDALGVVLSAFGNDVDGTIGATIAIECHGGSVLENVDMVDFGGVDDVHVALNAVDENQRRAAAERL